MRGRTSGDTNLPAEEVGMRGRLATGNLRVEKGNQPEAGGGIGRRFSARLPDRLYRSGTLESDRAGTDPGTL